MFRRGVRDCWSAHCGSCTHHPRPRGVPHHSIHADVAGWSVHHVGLLRFGFKHDGTGRVNNCPETGYAPAGGPEAGRTSPEQATSRQSAHEPPSCRSSLLQTIEYRPEPSKLLPRGLFTVFVLSPYPAAVECDKG